jgi:membrane protein
MKRLVREYLDTGATQYAGMLAFSLLVALVPLMLGVVTLWGLLARSPQRFAVAREMLVEIVPVDVQNAVRHVLLGAEGQIDAVALVTMLAMLWFSTGVFSTIGFALNRIFGMPDRPVIQQRLRGLWLAPALFGAAYLAVAVNIAVSRWSVPTLLGLIAVWGAVAWIVTFLYRLAPSQMLSRSEIWAGAVLAAFIIVGLTYVFPLYVNLTSHFSSGTRFFAAVFGLVGWLYFVAHAVLFGAVVNRTRLVAGERARLPSLNG